MLARGLASIIPGVRLAALARVPDSASTTAVRVVRAVVVRVDARAAAAASRRSMQRVRLAHERLVEEAPRDARLVGDDDDERSRRAFSTRIASDASTGRTSTRSRRFR